MLKKKQVRKSGALQTSVFRRKNDIFGILAGLASNRILHFTIFAKIVPRIKKMSQDRSPHGRQMAI